MEPQGPTTAAAAMNEETQLAAPPQYDPRHEPRRLFLPHPARTPELSLAAADAITPCSECGKQFSKPKALFGHMRCHPERPYRGINPRPLRPSAAAPSTSHTEFSANELDVAQSILLLSGGSPRKANRKSGVGRGGGIRKKRAYEETAAAGTKKRHVGWMTVNDNGSHCSTSKSYHWDLNLPPPEDGEGDAGLVWELKLGA